MNRMGALCRPLSFGYPAAQKLRRRFLVASFRIRNIAAFASLAAKARLVVVLGRLGFLIAARRTTPGEHIVRTGFEVDVDVVE